MQFLAEPAAAVLYSFFAKGESPEAKLTVVDNKRSEDFHVFSNGVRIASFFTAPATTVIKASL
jgi:hypothetical protein